MAQPASDHAFSTPEKKQKKYHSAIQDTSATPRSLILDAENTKINDNRVDILTIMKPEISECSLDRFQDYYAPFKIPANQVSAIISKLLEKKKNNHYICTKSAEGNIFAAFNKPPGKEDQTYRPLEDIAAAIAQAATEVDEFASERELNYFFRCCSRTQLRSDIAGSDHLVDGVFEERCTCGNGKLHTLSRHSKVVDGHAKSDVIQMRNIASVFEFKTGDNHEKKFDNGQKAVSASVQLMNEDPRRMFSYAFSIERFEMTLWYFCRSHSVMAGRIRLDSPNDFERLVTIFLSFMFATPEEMGYDPTITVHEDGDNTQYTYRIPGDQDRPQGANDRFFRTVATIDDPRSLNITGRSTRVWEVQEMESAEDDAAPVKNDGIPIPTCVLKDVWLESAAPTEWEIQKQIFADIKSFLTNISLSNDGLAKLSALQQKHAHLLEDDAFKRYFMTIIADYEGRETPAYAKHGTRSITNALEGVRRISKQSPQSGRQNTSVSRPVSAPGVPAQRKYATKRQYRVVFKELCKDVGKLGTLGNVMDVLQETLIPLQLMHCSGWVHRDISCGNVLAYKSGGDRPPRWQAKLSDLEYAKRFPPSKNDQDAEEKDPKTGTPYFMPYEILLGYYISAPTVTLTDEEILAKAAEEMPEDEDEDDDEDDDDEDDDDDDDDDDEEEEEDNKKKNKKNMIDEREEWLKWRQETKEKEMKERELLKDSTSHGSTEATTTPSYTVVHNPQHDVESLWWLGLWTLTRRVKHQSGRLWAWPIFQHSLTPSPQRRAAFFTNIKPALFKNLHRDLKEPFSTAMNLFREMLYLAYLLREQKDEVLQLDTYAKVYDYANKFFQDIQANRKSAKKWRKVKLMRDPDRVIPKAKRPRPVSDPEADDPFGSGHNEGSRTSAGQRSLKRPKV